MPKKIASEVEVLVKTFSKDGLSCRAIQKKLKELNFIVRYGAISNIINYVGFRRNHKSVGMASPKKYQPRNVTDKVLIQKLNRLISKESPPSLNKMATILKLSKGTIFNIIHQDLGATVRKKRAVHMLKPSHKSKRKTNSRKLMSNTWPAKKRSFVSHWMKLGFISKIALAPDAFTTPSPTNPTPNFLIKNWKSLAINLWSLVHYVGVGQYRYSKCQKM
jgi:hypothetical protein